MARLFWPTPGPIEHACGAVPDSLGPAIVGSLVCRIADRYQPTSTFWNDADVPATALTQAYGASGNRAMYDASQHQRRPWLSPLPNSRDERGGNGGRHRAPWRVQESTPAQFSTREHTRAPSTITGHRDEISLWPVGHGGLRPRRPALRSCQFSCRGHGMAVSRSGRPRQHIQRPFFSPMESPASDKTLCGGTRWDGSCPGVLRGRFVALRGCASPDNEYWCAHVLTAADADLPRAD